MSETLVSHHIFLFPFKWDILPPNKSIQDTSYFNRTRIETLVDFIEKKSKHWISSPFRISQDDADQYNTFNEYHYFFEYARDSLAINLDDNNTAFRYRYKLPEDKDCFYDITTSSFSADIQNSPEYRLIIKDILLTCYDTGVGALAYFLENHAYKDPEAILRINDFGRRIYPQFLGYEKSLKKTTEKDQGSTLPNLIGAPQGSFLAKSIQLVGLSEKPIVEDFSYYNNIEQLNGAPFRLPNHISALLGEDFLALPRSTAQRTNKKYVTINPIIDDRMFVSCFYANSEVLDRMNKYDESDRTYSYVQEDLWYALTFVDPSLDVTCKSLPMKANLLQHHSYNRWLQPSVNGKAEGHLFGLSRYSFLLLTDEGWFAKNILINHHRYLYFQMVTLALMQRATILRFASESARISKAISKGADYNWQKKQIREVYTSYLNFTNKVYFREITPQEQGIELYDKVRSLMEIDTDLLALQREIEELQRFSIMIDTEKSGDEAKLLSIIATVFLPPALIAGIFGFSNFPSDFSFFSSFLIWLGASGFFVILILAITRIRRWFSESKF